MKTKPITTYEEYINLQTERAGLKINNNPLSELHKQYLSKDDVILDIGCREEMFTVKELRKLGYNACGIDVIHYDIFDDKYYENIDIQENYTENHFTFISASHVLEHLYDPYMAIHNIRMSLKDNGKLFAVIPIQDEKAFKNTDEHFTMWESPQDFNNFLEYNGFKVLEWNYTKGYHDYELRVLAEKI